jgi:pimeloyl-ACP methyl ester carboxylesterase
LDNTKNVLTSDGTNIFVYIEGSGEPLIFLHGNGQTSHLFKSYLPLLSKKYQCILIDARSHGESEKSKSSLTFERMACDVAEVITALKIKQADVIGYSDGANVAMVLAAKHSQLVKKLILNSGNLTAEGSTALSHFLEEIYIFFGKYFTPWDNEVLSLLSEDTGLSFEDLGKITAETTVFVTQFDFIRKDHSMKICESIPHARFFSAKFATHFMVRFQKKRYAKLIDSFLSENRKGIG